MWATTVQQFLTMGGYASFVWPAYGLVIATLSFNVIIALWQTRRLQRKLRQRRGA